MGTSLIRAITLTYSFSSPGWLSAVDLCTCSVHRSVVVPPAVGPAEHPRTHHDVSPTSSGSGPVPAVCRTSPHPNLLAPFSLFAGFHPGNNNNM